MSCRTTPSTAPSITARPSAVEKARFASLAAARGMSEAALALNAIRAAIGTGTASSWDPHERDARVSATDRITIRLRPGDGEWISRRAAQRGMKSSAYLSALVRAHIARNPPLPANELAALKLSVVVLAGLGRLLARESKAPTGIARDDLQRTRAAIAELEQRMHALAKAALISWESRIA
jgi:hypothetical protein